MLCFSDLAFELRLLAIDGPSTDAQLMTHDGVFTRIMISHGDMPGFDIAEIVWNPETERLEATPQGCWDLYPRTAPKNPAEFSRIFAALGVVLVES